MMASFVNNNRPFLSKNRPSNHNGQHKKVDNEGETMNDVIHAIFFIFAFGALFVSVIIAEAWYLHRKGK